MSQRLEKNFNALLHEKMWLYAAARKAPADYGVRRVRRK